MKNVPIVAAKQLNTDSIKVVRLAETSGKVKQAVKVGNTPRTVTLTPVVTGGGTSGPATQVLLSGTVTPIVTGEGTSGPATQVLSPGTMTPNAKGGTSGPAKRILTPGTVTPLTGGPTLGPVLQISSPGTMIPFAKGGTSGPAKQIILTPGTVTPIVTGGETSGPAKQILSPGTMSVLTPITKGGTSEPAKQILSSGTVTPIVTGGGKPISVGGEKSGPIKLKNYLVGGKLVPGFILEGTKSASGQPILVLPSLNSEGKVVGKASTGTKKQILAEGGASNSVQQISTGSTLGGASGILQQSDIAKGSSSVSQGMATKIGGTSGVQRRVQQSHLKRTSKTSKKPVADDTSERSSSPTSVADHDHDYGQAPKHSKDFCRPSFKIRHRVCSVKNCNNSSEFYPDLKFFRLPKRDNSRLATWAKKIGRPEFVALRKNGKKNLGFVCAAHFHERYKGVSKLMKGAVPTEELPEVDSPENRFLIGGEVKVKPEILSRLHEEENPTAAPVFLSQLRDCTEEHFGTVKLQCLINSDSATVTWYHNGEKIQPCKHMAVKFESKSARVKKKLDYIFKIGVATLQITDPSARYSGVYMCQANSGDKYAVSCAYLSVVDMNTKAAEPLVECRKCRLTFITADKPKRLLDLALPKMKIEMAKPFDNITPSDGDAPPNWMMKLKSTKTRLCKSVILTCMYDDPEASATWYRNGKRLQVCKHYDTLLSASKDRRYAVLRIMPISMDDFGMYTCVAINRRLFASSTSCILSREDEGKSTGV
ncbi:uncharacterized protein [Amphiura filiformis]|uniref:uncharacterized protein n=1 Tax=Amphiura filiformis TaxID=82378 RepID=UPI003B20FFB3